MKRAPLAGVRIVEFAGVGPGPFAAMMLADLGAEVIRVERPGALEDPGWSQFNPLLRNRSSIAINLKRREGVEIAHRLIEEADAVLEGFRPGVMERLGLGPEECRVRNPRLVYVRMTGWGQDGPLHDRAGHDINFLAASGALHAMGTVDTPPPPPLNVVADYGGGGMIAVIGLVAGLVGARETGVGSVVDAAMVDGAALLASVFHGLLAAGRWTEQREANLLDGGAPFYRCYRCGDGLFIAVGALEPEFYSQFLAALELDPNDWPQGDVGQWNEQIRTLNEIFSNRTRDEWVQLFDGFDACVSPVLTFTEAKQFPHTRFRSGFIEIGGVSQPAPSPRFTGLESPTPTPPRWPGDDTSSVLEGVGYPEATIQWLFDEGVVATRSRDSHGRLPHGEA